MQWMRSRARRRRQTKDENYPRRPNLEPKRHSSKPKHPQQPGLRWSLFTDMIHNLACHLQERLPLHFRRLFPTPSRGDYLSTLSPDLAAAVALRRTEPDHERPRKEPLSIKGEPSINLHLVSLSSKEWWSADAALRPVQLTAKQLNRQAAKAGKDEVTEKNKLKKVHSTLPIILSPMSMHVSPEISPSQRRFPWGSSPSSERDPTGA